MLGDGERLEAASPGCSLFLVGGVLVCGEVRVGVMAWRWTCPWDLEGFGVWGPGCSGGLAGGGRELVFSVEAQRPGMSAAAQCWKGNKRKGGRAGRARQMGSTLTKLLCRGRMDNNWMNLSSFRGFQSPHRRLACGAKDTFLRA